MTRYKTLLRLAPLLAAGFAAAVIGACADNGPTDVVPALTPVDPLFASYVALGNSITAGYQSGGIVDSTQRQSYAGLLASAMNTRYVYPSLVFPGCPPPVVNFQTQARLGGTTAPPCALRDTASVSTVLNNVAVPGALAVDPTGITTASSNQLTMFILGGKTQVQKAADANATFFTAWVGNNDALAAGIQGVIDSVAAKAYNLPGRLTPQTSFTTSYGAMATGLKAIPTLKGGVLIGVIQVASAPVLFPAQALFNPAFKAGFDQFAGGTTTILPSCTATTTALVSFQLASAMRAGTHPRVIGCAKNSVPGTPVGDIFILDPGEQTALATAITNYNTYIQSVATANGWAYYDPNPLLVTLKATVGGCITTVPNLASATQPFGSCISLDGIHPAAPAHVRLETEIAAAIDAKYGTKLSSAVVRAP
ncbi:MAG: SGNH/GDSL hydrolase family protein [Gemmatimonadaceae bacterium]